MIATKSTSLYRLYGAADQLLYVGIAGNPGRRFEQHAADKAWWGEVSRVELQHFPSRDEALEAERQAIKAERPRYNIVHLPPADLAVTWICDVCKERMVEGLLQVSTSDAYASKRYDEGIGVNYGGFRVTSAAQIMDGPGPARWKCTHWGCDPVPDTEDLYWFDVQRIATWPAVLRWTAHLIEKNWLEHTDWSSVLYRLASRTSDPTGL